jgi:hypothetical protein
MHDPEASGQDTDFYVIGLNPYELENNIKHNDGTWHELGHAILVDNLIDAKLMHSAFSLKSKHLPEVALADKYRGILAQSIPESIQGKDHPLDFFIQWIIWQLCNNNYELNNAFKLFHERNAWAAGYRLQKNIGFPSGFQNFLSRIKYSDLCLESYSHKYHDPRFIKGLR